MDILRQHLKGERGRLQKLADALGIYPSAVLQWKKIPAERVPAVESATGIPRHDLRPDLYDSNKPASKRRKVSA
jgi:DNA-binding transcriptional regulator YdaS (Cro superfamily)